MRLEILHLLMALYSLELMMLFRPFVIVAELWNVWPVNVLFSFCQCAPVMWQSCGMCGGPGWSHWVWPCHLTCWPHCPIAMLLMLCVTSALASVQAMAPTSSPSRPNRLVGRMVCAERGLCDFMSVLSGKLKRQHICTHCGMNVSTWLSLL